MKIQPLHINTPCRESRELGKAYGGQVIIKLDSEQPTGSFKIRGIGNLCSKVVQNHDAKKLVCSSGGNAGIAVAYAGKKLGIPVTAVIPKTTSEHMIKRIKNEEAEVRVEGEDWNSADKVAREIAAEEGCYYISPFDDPLIWEGHTTIIKEVAETGVKPDAVVVAVGGGGLFCGVVQGMKEVGWDDVPVFVSETEGAASFAAAIKAGTLVTLDKVNSIATSLCAKRVAEQALEWTKHHPVVSKVVTDKQAVNACLRFADDERVLVEPACGAALSIVYDKLIDAEKYPTVLVIICGGVGVTLDMLAKWKTMFP